MQMATRTVIRNNGLLFMACLVFGGLPSVILAGTPEVGCLDEGDVADVCTRTFVLPKRIVWQTRKSDNGFGPRCSVTGAEALLAPKRGQIPESGEGAREAACCQMTNSRNSPGLILDFGKELQGGLQFGMGARTSRNMKLRVRFGESVAETMSDALAGTRGESNDHAIRDLVIELPVMGTAEIGNTGFRFVRIDLLTAGTAGFESIRAIELKRPMKRVGAFRSSDERLNRIWETSVRTVHLCCQNYIWDGIKRDRLVWMGDTHPETMTVLNVFGKEAVIPDSLDYMAATTDAKTGWMNGIGSYTLWWVRNLADWYRFTGDRAYVEKHRRYLADTMNRLVGHVTPSNAFWGVKRPFLDWPTEHNRPAVFSGMQALAAIAFDDGAFLAGALGDDALRGTCEKAARTVRGQVGLEAHGAKSAAALLALSGLRDAKEMYDSTIGRDGHEGVSTFYGYYMLEAMSAANENQRALDTVRDYWGAMLDVGATTFWEDFKLSWTNNCFRIDEMPVEGKVDVHGDFGEFCYLGFRHSLCHGWSSGPAAWCINHILGIHPLSPGCTKVEVKPDLCDLKWAEGAMALPSGEAVRVRVERKSDGALDVSVSAPEWVEIVRPSGVRP